MSTALALLAIVVMGAGVWLLASRPVGDPRWKRGFVLLGVGVVLNVASDALDGPDPARSAAWHISTLAVALVLIVAVDRLGERRKRRHGVRLTSADGRVTTVLLGDWTRADLAAAEADLADHGGVLTREHF